MRTSRGELNLFACFSSTNRGSGTSVLSTVVELNRLDAADRNLQNVNPENNSNSNIRADVFVSSEGSIFLFTPLTPEAELWIAENVQPDAQ
jgi:hypothetical protein